MTKQVQLGPGHHVRVTNPQSLFYGEKGTVIGQGRWGYLIVEIVKGGKTYRPEILRGRLELVQEGENHEISRHSPH